MDNLSPIQREVKDRFYRIVYKIPTERARIEEEAGKWADDMGGESYISIRVVPLIPDRCLFELTVSEHIACFSFAEKGCIWWGYDEDPRDEIDPDQIEQLIHSAVFRHVREVAWTRRGRPYKTTSHIIYGSDEYVESEIHSIVGSFLAWVLRDGVGEERRYESYL